MSTGQAVALDGTDVVGRPIRVDFATVKTGFSPRNGGSSKGRGDNGEGRGGGGFNEEDKFHPFVKYNDGDAENIRDPTLIADLETLGNATQDSVGVTTAFTPTVDMSPRGGKWTRLSHAPPPHPNQNKETRLQLLMVRHPKETR